MNRSVVIFIVGCLYACGGTGQKTKIATPGSSPVSTEQSDTGKSGATLLGGEFGDSLWGFSEGSSENGRFVFLRRFPGADKPEFGHHGEAMGASPVLSVFDRFTGVERKIDELIDTAGRRWFLVIDAETLFSARCGYWRMGKSGRRGHDYGWQPVYESSTRQLFKVGETCRLDLIGRRTARCPRS